MSHAAKQLTTFSTIIKNTTVCVLTFTAIVFFTSAVYASEKDSKQPITIEADAAKVDEKKGLSTYTGHVLLIQGGIQIKADELKVFSDKGQLNKLIATGEPVIYSQVGDATRGDIVGEALKMEYFASDGKLNLYEKAKLSQGANQFSGNHITYDTQRQVVSAAVSETGKERVQVTIQPKSSNTPK